MGVDVTARKTMELAIKKSEQRLYEAQRVARIGDYEWDPKTGISYVAIYLPPVPPRSGTWHISYQEPRVSLFLLLGRRECLCGENASATGEPFEWMRS